MIGLVFGALVSAQSIVISQVYGGGGNSGATLKNDFIELFNRSSVPVNLTGWSVQYASTTGSTWQKTDLTNVVLQPGQYYLVQEAQGTGGTVNLPTPDAIGTIAMSGSAGKVALLSTTALVASGTVCPTDNVVDKVGYGPATTCSETSPTSSNLSNTTAALRASGGCVDTSNNSADFSNGTPNPRNTASPVNDCSAPPPGCTQTHTISQIQGTGATTPLSIGSTVATQGIVTARLSNAFLIQSPPQDDDANPATSEGLYVFTSSAPPSAAALGNLICVTGTLAEFGRTGSPRTVTELTGPTVTAISTGNSVAGACGVLGGDDGPQRHNGPVREV